MAKLAAAFLALAFLLAPAPAWSQAYQFADLPWGISKHEAAQRLVGAGYTGIRNYADDLAFSDGLNGRQMSGLARFAGDRLAKVEVELGTPDGRARTTYTRLRHMLIERHGKPTTDLDFISPPYRAGEGLENDAIREGKGMAASWWLAPDRRAVSLSISPKLLVVIEYESPSWQAEAARRQALEKVQGRK
jgi:hypothetical protein